MIDQTWSTNGRSFGNRKGALEEAIRVLSDRSNGNTIIIYRNGEPVERVERDDVKREFRIDPVN